MVQFHIPGGVILGAVVVQGGERALHVRLLQEDGGGGGAFEELKHPYSEKLLITSHPPGLVIITGPRGGLGLWATTIEMHSTYMYM